jgi:cytoskeleton protein RodZ
MSEEQEKQPKEEAAEREPEGPFGGERLAQARREQQISVLEIAKELHLDEAKVRALERNEFDVLGAPVFAKGHLRKYAHLVGVDQDDVFADYYKMTHTAELPPVVVGRQKVRQELSPGPWIAVGVVIVLAAIAYWWFATASRAPTDDAAPPAVPDSAESAAGESAGAGDDVAEDDIDDTADDAQEPAVPEAETPGGETPIAVAEPQPQSEPVDDGQTRIQLTFSGDCWTEISDATGQRLFFNMGRAGRTVELAGTAPFSVLFGNAGNVSVSVDGNEYPVAPTSPGSRTARLTIIKP